MGMSDNWQTHAKYWSQFYEVHAIDQRNHGKSFHSESFSYALLAEDIVTYMEANALKEAVVLGHSMGGKTAMTLALTYPNRVSQLIVADIAPKVYDVASKFAAIIEGMLDLNRTTLTARKEADSLLQAYVSDIGVRMFLLKNMKWTPERTLTLKCNIEVLSEKLHEIGAANFKGTFQGKTLFIAGENSDYIADNDTLIIKQYFPNASMASVAQAGHWIHAENPEGFTKVIHDFLA